MTAFAPAPRKPTVSPAVLESIDIRLGTIQAVDDVAGSKKLIRLTVSFGDHARQILAGMKQERADLNSLIGRQANQPWFTVARDFAFRSDRVASTIDHWGSLNDPDSGGAESRACNVAVGQ